MTCHIISFLTYKNESRHSLDSLTQIALGASVAAVVGIKPFGRKVLLAGAALGTLPDLDIFISYNTAIDNFTFHRSFSHSLFVLSLFSLLLYCLALWLKPQWRSDKKALFLVILLPLITHPLLDGFTTYGTQLWWPMTMQPTSWSSVFIIDPLYTLPLLISVIGLWCHQRSEKWQKTNRIILLVSCLYLTIGQTQLQYLKYQVANDPITKNNQVFISPTPFNIVLWRVMSYQGDVYHEAFTTVFNQEPLQWKASDSGRKLLQGFNSKELQRLEWFSGGLLKFERKEGELIVTDLRLGFSHVYPFSFSLAEQDNGWVSIPSEKMPELDVNWGNIKKLINSLREK